LNQATQASRTWWAFNMLATGSLDMFIVHFGGVGHWVSNYKNMNLIECNILITGARSKILTQ